MKLLSLLLVAYLFAAAGCHSGRIPEPQAVSDADKVAAFMHPDHYASYRDWGVEVVNDPRETGVAGVGKLKFLLGTVSFVSTNEPPQEWSQAVGQPQFRIRDRLRVFVSHSGVRR